MTLEDLSEHASAWLRDEGPDGGVVISSRVRLARNLAGYPFLSKAGAAQRTELLTTCQSHILDANLAPQMLWVDLSESSRLDQRLLVERRLISHQHGRGRTARGVALSSGEDIAIMVNEEDHLRVQVMRAGMQLDDAYAHADRIDDTLESQMDFAYSSKLGYLTACPTNVGTGIRVSVMLHLPALKLTGEIDKLQQAAKDMHLAVRGFYGEGSEASGDLFQLSNQTTLGRSEQQILADFQESVVPALIAYENRAREAVADQRPAVLDDRVWRAWGTLTQARLLGAEEAMGLLSHLRMGATLGRIDTVPLATVNELFLLIQPAHLQRIAGRSLNAAQRREFRATYIRRRLGT